MEKDRFQIILDGNLYEGSDDYDIAVRLYRTVDKTCLPRYNGKEKRLYNNVTAETIRCDKVKTFLTE